MRAIPRHEYGGVEKLSLGEAAVPEIGDEEVLVRVHAAAADRGTSHLMAGLPDLVRVAGFGPRTP